MQRRHGILVGYYSCGATGHAQNMNMFLLLGWFVPWYEETRLLLLLNRRPHAYPFHVDANGIFFPLYLQHAVATIITALADTAEL